MPDRLGGRSTGTLALALGAASASALIAVWPTVAGLVVGTIVFAAGMSLMYPALLLLALDGVSDAERASVVGTFSSFFDASQGLGALICGIGRRGHAATAARSRRARSARSPGWSCCGRGRGACAHDAPRPA